MDEENLNAGHRERLKQKFLSLKDDIPDYELLELLLTYAIPRKDVKPLAKQLLARFGSLGSVLSASEVELVKVDGVKLSTAVLLQTVFVCVKHILKREMQNKPVMSSWEDIENYCYALLGRETKECVYIIPLDANCRVIDAIRVQKGTVDQSAVYVREVLEILIANHAISFLMVHNHPSGSSQPSRADLAITATLRETTKKMSIKMLDHLIISPKGLTSFSLMGLMD